VEQAEVEIRLTPAEIVVLFEFLHRYTESGRLAVEDQSEQRALWNLLCILERVILPGSPYPDLEHARASLRDTVE
jgi:hypothetical protein